MVPRDHRLSLVVVHGAVHKTVTAEDVLPTKANVNRRLQSGGINDSRSPGKDAQLLIRTLREGRGRGHGATSPVRWLLDNAVPSSTTASVGATHLRASSRCSGHRMSTKSVGVWMLRTNVSASVDSSKPPTSTKSEHPSFPQWFVQRFLLRVSSNTRGAALLTSEEGPGPRPREPECLLGRGFPLPESLDGSVSTCQFALSSDLRRGIPKRRAHQDRSLYRRAGPAATDGGVEDPRGPCSGYRAGRTAPACPLR
eukprot:scaffold6348_cov259-Pinguiococcus_pyrenoidosus.AAC.13